MKERIGHSAGDIWKIIKKHNEVNVEQLPDMLQAKPAEVFHALVWLEREEKIIYHVKGTNIFVSLKETEHRLCLLSGHVPLAR